MREDNDPYVLICVHDLQHVCSGECYKVTVRTCILGNERSNCCLHLSLVPCHDRHNSVRARAQECLGGPVANGPGVTCSSDKAAHR